MNSDVSRSSALSYIASLVSHISESNKDSCTHKIAEFLEENNQTTQLNIFSLILQWIENSCYPATEISPVSCSNPSLLADVLQNLSTLISPPIFTDLFLSALLKSKTIKKYHTPNQPPKSALTRFFSNHLKFHLLQEWCIFLSLYQKTNSIELRTEIENHYKVKLNPIQSFQAGSPLWYNLSQDLNKKYIALRSEKGGRATRSSTETLESSRLQDLETCVPVLKSAANSIVSDNLLDMSESVLSDLFLEAGPSKSSTLEDCRQLVARCPKAAITAPSVARLIIALIRHIQNVRTQNAEQQSLNGNSSMWAGEGKDKAVGRGDSTAPSTVSWSIEPIMQAVMEQAQAPISPKEVLVKFDCKGFFVGDRVALSLFVTSTRALSNNMADMYPIDRIYHKWQCQDEQLMLLSTMIKNPDIFCFSDYQCTPVSIEMLKSVPELENKEVATWRSLNLIDLLLSFETTHFSPVKSLFGLARQNCPDVLLLGVVQCCMTQSTLSHMRTDLLKLLLPIFLEPHPNTTAVLQTAWHSPGPTSSIKQLILVSITEWYMQAENDQGRLSRILDLAQDLKALSLLLNMTAFAFVIDLACLAFRREFLKLDKWLADKASAHGEPFITALVKFIQQRCPQMVSGPSADDLSGAKATLLPTETISTITQSLTGLMRSGLNLSSDMNECLVTIIQNGTMLTANRQRNNPSMMTSFSQSDTLGLSSSLANLSLNSATAAGIFPPGSSGAPPPVAGNLPGNIAPSLGGTALTSAGPGALPPGSPARGLSLSGTQQAIGHQQAQHQPAIGSQLTSQNVVPPPMDMSMSTMFELPATVSKEVEDEANMFFQKIYNNPPNSSMTNREILELLKKFQKSSITKEREVYACMLRNLFEEYKFFPTYPHKELFTTAQLFGGIIDEGLVEYVALGVALRYVMEALQKPHGSKMYYFGILALDRFRGRLKEYPRYCQHINLIEHFHAFPAHLIEWIRFGGQSSEPPNRPTGTVLPTDIDQLDTNAPNMSQQQQISMQQGHGLPSVVNPNNAIMFQQQASTSVISQSQVARQPIGMAASTSTRASGTKPSITSTNIDTLLVASEQKETTLVAPSEKQNEAIAFIFNNLSQLNLEKKAADLVEAVPDECWNWVAQYLVMKRASIEANFHNLYSNFLDHLKNVQFTKKVIEETLRNIKVLLKVDKTSANFSDKSLLKNLGHWLGLLTLAKSKPILHNDISMKSLLIEAYLKGLQELQYVVPFVAKVLESCSKSKIFKPPNPWTLGLLKVLAEIRAMPEMKLHLKFEIEVLCKKLEISLEDIEPGSVLQNANINSLKEYQLTPMTNSFVTPPVATTSGDSLNDSLGVFGRTKRADSTPLLPAIPNFPNHQAFMSNVPNVQSVSDSLMQGVSSSSAGATPTSQLSQQSSVLTGQNQGGASTPLNMHANASAVGALAMPAELKSYTYNEINVTTLKGLEQHLTLNSVNIPPELNSGNQFKSIMRSAFEVAVQEVLTLMMDRSVRIANNTAETIIKKDFALDPDENQMRHAAHSLVRNLTAANALSSTKEILPNSLASAFEQKLDSHLNTRGIIFPVDLVKSFVSSIVAENITFVNNFIQKTCAEKAVIEIDKKLAGEYEARKNARAENRHYCDTSALAFQAEVMPEVIRQKVGRISQDQMQLYESFANNIPGFAPAPEVENTASAALLKTNTGATEIVHFLSLTERVPVEIESMARIFTSITSADNSVVMMLNGMYNTMMHLRSNRDMETVLLLMRKCLEHIFTGNRELFSDPELSTFVIKFRDLHLFLLKTLAEPGSFGAQWVSKYITKWWIEMVDDIKYNVEIFDWLLRLLLINLPILDEYFSRCLEDPKSNMTVIVFVVQLLQVYIIDDNNAGFISESDLQHTFDMMIRLVQRRQAPEVLERILDAVRVKNEISQVAATASDRVSLVNPSAGVVGSSGNAGQSALASAVSAAAANASNANVSLNVSNATQAVVTVPGQQTNSNTAQSSVHFHSGVNQARDFNDPMGLQDKTDHLLREWIALYHSPTAGPGSSTAFTHFVKQMNVHGILKTDDLITRFFRNCVTYCRDVCARNLSDQRLQETHPQQGGQQIPLTPASAVSQSQMRNKCFQHVDPFVRLLALLIKHSGEASNPSTKVNLLNKVLGLVCGIMIHDIDTSGMEFFQLSYHRIFIMLFLELNAPEPVVESINLSVLIAFTQTLHLLRPSKCPGFAYAWLEIVSHRVFIGRMLAITQQKAWAMYAMLLTDLFKFLCPFLRNAELANPLVKLYKGTLRVLLVLLHDFPEFLCEYYYGFCDAIPPNCIQMRNLILSAFPRNMRLPDPFTPNLKVDMLSEISHNPRMNVSVASYINPVELKNNLDSYLKNRTPVTFLGELRGYLQAPPNTMAANSLDDGMHYNISLLNALVVYVGMQAIAHISAKGLTPSMSTISHSAHMDIFQNLAVDMDTEGRYLFLNAIANQLRYPNSHTHYFSCTLLYLFVETNTEAIQEQITRVLLERLIVNRPHPWGLLITFIELIKNPTYNFWCHEFVKCAPEIEKLFESVARSCMVNKTQRESES